VIYSIGAISGIIVIIIIIGIMNYGCISMIAITAMVIVVIMTINANCHNRKGCKIRRIKPIIIRWIIGHIRR
jgi:hypothetical protein